MCKQLPAAQHRGRLRCVCLQAGGSHRAQARATTHAQDTPRRNQTYQSPNRHRALRPNSPSTPVVASSRRSLSLSLQSLPMSPSRRRYPRHATRTQRGATRKGEHSSREAHKSKLLCPSREPCLLAKAKLDDSHHARRRGETRMSVVSMRRTEWPTYRHTVCR